MFGSLQIDTQERLGEAGRQFITTRMHFIKALSGSSFQTFGFTEGKLSKQYVYDEKKFRILSNKTGICVVQAKATTYH